MSTLIVLALESNLAMSGVSTVLLIIMPLLARRFTSRCLFTAWKIAILGCLFPLGILNLFPKPEATRVMTSVIEQISNTTVIGRMCSSPVVPITLGTVLFCLWAFGSICMISHHLRKHIRFLRMERRWEGDVEDAELLSLFNRLIKEMGIQREICLKICPVVGTPMMVGFFRPRVLLPHADYTDKNLSAILKHELIHYKRRDLLLKTILLLVRSAYWFNPLIYVAERAITLQCEISCDEMALADLGADARKRYCEGIVVFVRSDRAMRTVFSSSLYAGKADVKKRIRSVLRMDRKNPANGILIAVSLLVLGSGLLLIEPHSASLARYALGVRGFILADNGWLYQFGDVEMYRPDPAVSFNLFHLGQAPFVQSDGVRTSRGEVLCIPGLADVGELSRPANYAFSLKAGDTFVVTYGYAEQDTLSGDLRVGLEDVGGNRFLAAAPLNRAGDAATITCPRDGQYTLFCIGSKDNTHGSGEAFVVSCYYQ